jgi:hypothetical protein
MTYVFVVLIIFFCGYIQTIAGFAFSLISVPALLLCGFNLPDAVVLTIVCSASQKVMLVWHCRKDVAWKTLFLITPWAILGLAAGVLILKKLSSVPPDTIKQIFGAIIILTVALKIFAKVKPREKVSTFSGCVVAAISGISHGFANIGGPPIVLWALAHKWSKDRLRSFVPCFVILLLPVQIIFMLIAFGSHILIDFAGGLLYIPVILLAFWLGNITSKRMSIERVRFIISLLLLITGVAYIIMPFAKKLFAPQEQKTPKIENKASQDSGLNA